MILGSADLRGRAWICKGRVQPHACHPVCAARDHFLKDPPGKRGPEAAHLQWRVSSTWPTASSARGTYASMCTTCTCIYVHRLVCKRHTCIQAHQKTNSAMCRQLGSEHTCAHVKQEASWLRCHVIAMAHLLHGHVCRCLCCLQALLLCQQLRCHLLQLEPQLTRLQLRQAGKGNVLLMHRAHSTQTQSMLLCRSKAALQPQPLHQNP